MDIDPRHRGYEMWASGPGLTGVWNVKGEKVSDRKPRSCNFGVWWDGDLLRELLDRTTISKWDWKNERETVLLDGRRAARRTTAPRRRRASVRDILGDWREEVIWRTTRQQGAAHLHDDDPDRAPALHADARPAVPPERGVAERRLQPAAAAGLLPWPRHEGAAAAEHHRHARGVEVELWTGCRLRGGLCWMASRFAVGQVPEGDRPFEPPESVDFDDRKASKHRSRTESGPSP